MYGPMRKRVMPTMVSSSLPPVIQCTNMIPTQPACHPSRTASNSHFLLHQSPSTRNGRSLSTLCSHEHRFRRSRKHQLVAHKSWHDHPPHSNSMMSRRWLTSLNQDTPYQLCFLRHGQSTWNRDNRFIGWTDTPLTDDGVLEARVAGQMLYQAGMKFDEVHTSMLRRSIRTANLVLMELGQEYIPMYKHWRLNERNYGSLVGLDKKQVVQQYGKDQVKRWRRSYDEPPPVMSPDHPYHPAQDPRYQEMKHLIPTSESLKDTLARSSVYWNEVLVPALRENKSLLIVGHENNLRSLLMVLEDIAPKDIIELNLPRAVPLVYRMDLETMKPLPRPDGRLDEATGYLRCGEWIGGDGAVQQILERDYKQVYDTSVQVNLETHCSDRQKWTTWMESVLGKPSPEAKAKAADSTTCPTNNHVETMTTTAPPSTTTTTTTSTTTSTNHVENHTTNNSNNNNRSIPSPQTTEKLKCITTEKQINQGHPLQQDDQKRQEEEKRGFFPPTLAAPPVPGGEIDFHYVELCPKQQQQQKQQQQTSSSNSHATVNGHVYRNNSGGNTASSTTTSVNA